MCDAPVAGGDDQREGGSNHAAASKLPALRPSALYVALWPPAWYDVARPAASH
jgi:hypothetical protein